MWRQLYKQIGTARPGVRRCLLLSASTDNNLPPQNIVRCVSSDSSDGRADNDGKNSDVKHFPAAGKFRSTWTVLKEEFSGILEGKIVPAENKIPRETDILIIGGGVIGSSVAYWLNFANRAGLSVTVVERDPGYTRASSMLSAGGIRHQFTLPENVQLSMFTTEFLRNIKTHLSVLDNDPPDVQFNHQGYLFLAPADRAENLMKHVEMQRQLGAKVELMSKEKLAQKFPWLNLQDVEVGSYGLEGEGWFDPWLLLRAFKSKCVNLGVRYVTGDLIGFDIETANQGTGVPERQKLVNANLRADNGDIHSVKFGTCINCAGPWAGEVARLAGIGTGEGDLSVPLPVEPRKRFVYVFHCPDGPGLEMPFVINTDGAYVRREGLQGYYICGASPAEDAEPDISNLEVDYEFFDEYIWPSLANRVPTFEKLKLKSAWAGYYDYNTVDQNVVIGRHPYFHNFVFANGLSGHGIQHAPAIGRAVSEIVMSNHYETIDLSRFAFDRLLSSESVREMAIV